MKALVRVRTDENGSEGILRPRKAFHRLAIHHTVRVLNQLVQRDVVREEALLKSILRIPRV